MRRVIPHTSLSGFTLVEMLVSIFIFSMVMMIAVGSLLSMVDANKKAQTIKAAVNNLSFALDGMSRSIRVGTNFRCTNSSDATNATLLAQVSDCTGGGTLIAFEPFNGDPSNNADQWAYCLGSGTTCSANGTSILRSQDGGASYESITAPEVVVQDLHFYVKGSPLPSGETPSLQPKIVMVLHGYAGTSDKTKTELRLETTMTPRLLDE